MSETQGGGAPARKSKALYAALAVVVIVAALYAAYAVVFKPRGDLKSLATGSMAKLVVDKTPAAQPIEAQGPDGKAFSLADLKGQVVVVNLWASWCGPCVIEMPTLAKLQAHYAGRPVKVIPISLDKEAEGIAKAKAFLGDKKPLQFYHGDYSVAFDVGAQNLPTTLIFDRSGRERARLEGGADWSTAQADRVIDALLAKPS